MIEFGEKLEEHLLGSSYPNDPDGFLWGLVGPGSDPTYVCNTIDDHLHGFDLEETVEPWPMLVVTVRANEKAVDGEIGFPHDIRNWRLNIYYIDLVEDYKQGKKRRSHIMSRVEKYLEKNPRLGGFTVNDGDTSEYVYDLEIPNLMFDYSGHEDYHTFTCEMYVNVYTGKS